MKTDKETDEMLVQYLPVELKPIVRIWLMTDRHYQFVNGIMCALWTETLMWLAYMALKVILK